MKAFSSKHVLNTVAEMKKRGIKFYFGQEVSEIKRAENSFTVITSKDTQIQADYVVDASGRIANIDRLKLENTDVKTDKHGVIVNDHLQTAADNIYALGDVISKKEPKLVPTAKFEAEYLTHAFINNDNTPIKYPIIGSSAFTFPQIAQVGVNVDEARDNVDYTVKDIDKLSHSDMEYAGRNDQSAKLSLVFNKKGELVGAAESSQTAVNDINGYIPLIGLHVNYQLIFPAVSFKTEATI